MGKKVSVKKKRKSTARLNARFYVTVVVLMFIIASILIIVLNNRENAKIAATGTKIYFYDQQSGSLKPEYRQLTVDENTEKVKFVLEELSVGPRNSTISSASVPPDIIRSAVISGTNVDVNVSSDYLRLKSSEEIICRTAIVYSLTDLEFVETVSINIDGSELLRPNGQPFGKIKAGDIITSPEFNPQSESFKTITLYFADANGTGLIAESRTVATSLNEAVEKYIVQELIRGPASEELRPTVPPETKLLEITVRDGVCSVDLSRDFLTRHTGAPGSEVLTIYSIVNSLCDLSDISSVQFLIEGKRQEQFKAVTGFNNLYEAKELPPAETE